MSRHWTLLFVLSFIVGCPDMIPADGNGSEEKQVGDKGEGAKDGDGKDKDEDDDPAPMPTWADCRVAFLGNGLDEKLERLCEQAHGEAPSQRDYGIHWVFLNPVADPEQWTQSRVNVANEIYEAVGLSFRTVNIVEIEDSVVEVLQDDNSLTLAERRSDLVGHLEMKAEDELDPIESLRQRLLKLGGSPEEVEDLDGDSPISNHDFLKLMARCHPESIYIVVGDRPAEQAGVGGFASPPFMRFPDLRRSFIALKTNHRRLTVLSHELGHYFGLKHPHASSAGGENSHIFAKRNVANRYRAKETHELWAVLQEALGSNLSRPFVEIYPAYDASTDALLDFNARRYALMDTWVRFHFTLNGDFEPMESFAEFVAVWRLGEDLLQRNFMTTGEEGRKSNNCTWQQGSEQFACSYPQRERELEADDPILNEVILFDDGQFSNLMSYIREPGPDALARQRGLIQAQHDIIRLSANTPARLGLRNYSLEH